MKPLLRSLGKAAQQQATQAATGLLMAGAAALVAEGMRRTMPEMQIDGGANLIFLSRLLGQKPGAPRGPANSLTDDWMFGYGNLLFEHGGHWYFASHSPKKEGGDARGSIQSLQVAFPSIYGGGGNASTSYASGPRIGLTSGMLCVRALTGGQASLEALLKAAQDKYRPPQQVSVHVWEGTWTYLDGTRPRPLSTVAVEGDLADNLLADMRGFLSDEGWYHSLHVPYRRGYLLYGPPGSGKSTLAGALAAEAGLDVCILSLADKDLNDVTFMQALRQMPKKSILLLEDVDAVNAQTERRSPAREELEEIGPDHWIAQTEGPGGHIINHIPPGKLTLAGILNALDGLTTPNGLIVMMTTNHREKLDPALIRPGRVDYHAEIGLATYDQAVDLYRRFFPDAPREASWGFAGTIQPGTVSPATIQEHLVRHRYDPVGAAKGLKASA